MGFNLQSVPLTSGVKVLKCGACKRLCEPLGVEGKGNAKVLILFEEPTQIQQVNRSWMFGENSVFKALSQLGYDVRSEFYVTGVFACSGSSTNYEYCLSKLEDNIKKLKPALIIAVGDIASGAVLRLYNPRHFGFNFQTNKYLGTFIPLPDWSCYLATVQKDSDIHSYQNPAMIEVAKKWLRYHLDYALNNYLPSPVHVQLPQTELLYNTKDIAEALSQASVSKYAAFDYETNCLQPEQEKARVLTASVAYGDEEKMYRGVAFPLTSEVVKLQWVEFLRSSSKKIIANVKFEERWSLVLFKQSINNFYWDVCIGGRIRDCYSGMAGLKFLTFTEFGVIGYDDDVAPYIEDDETKYNKLVKMDVSKLLEYNCLDSIYTYALAKRQHEQFGMAF